MRNENPDEKVTSVNPVNQSQRAESMQLPEASHTKKKHLITVAVDIKSCDVALTRTARKIRDQERSGCHTHLTLRTVTLYLHIKSHWDQCGDTVGCWNGKSMATNIHYGKIGTDGLCFYCLGSGQCVAVSKSSPLTHKNELSERHFYLLQ